MLRRLGAVALVCAAIAPLLSPSSAAAASGPLVLSGPEMTGLGFHSRPPLVAAAKGTLAAGLPRGTRRAIDNAQVEVSGGHGKGGALAFDAFVFGHTGTAKGVLAEWRKKHRARAAAVGDGGYVWARVTRRRGLVEVLWRHGSRLGLVEWNTTHDPNSAPNYALGYAALAESHLSAVLPTTAWEKVIAQVRPDGTVSERTALEAVALVYGRLPGVHPPSGPLTGVAPADVAIDWIWPYLSTLKGKLERAVYRRLGLTLPGATAKAASYRNPDLTPDPTLTDFTQDPTLTAGANTWAQRYSFFLHHQLSLTIVAGETSKPIWNKLANSETVAQSYTVNAAGQPSNTGPYCVVEFGPLAYDEKKGLDALDFQHVLAHEVFHCEEDDFDPGLKQLGEWEIEGLAEWAAETLVPDPGFLYVMGNYVTSPSTPLFDRDYTAEGFWGHAQDASPGGLWNEIPAILKSPNQFAGYAAAGGDASGFLTTWGSSAFNLGPGEPSQWQIVSPAMPSGHPPTTTLGNPVNFVEAAPGTTAQYYLETPEPLLHVQLDGDGDLSTKYNYTNLGDAWFCTQASCACPPGTKGTPPATRPLLPTAGVRFGLGIASSPNQATHGALAFVPLSTFCTQPAPTSDGDAESIGDPHLFDFARQQFDFMGAGEYTLLKSTTDDLQIQVRQRPIKGAEVQLPEGEFSFSGTTAVAARVGSHTVELDLNTSGSSNRPFVVYVNRRNAAATDVRLGGGRLTVNQHADSAEVRWPDGSTLRVSNDLSELWLFIHLAKGRFGHVEGLLGTWAPASDPQFVGRNGTAYPPSEILDYDYNVLYDRFGNSWRITQHESLFRYPRGKNTNSYTIRGFPRRILTPGSLPAETEGSAKQKCQAAGITNSAMLDACIVDVSATGNTKFATKERQAQTEAGLPSNSTQPMYHSIDLGEGQTAPKVVYDPSSGDTYVAWLDGNVGSIDLCVVGRSADRCNGGAGPYHLTDPLASSGAINFAFEYPQLVLQPGGTVVLLADTLDASSNAYPPGYSSDGVVGWSSPAGGAAFGSGDRGLLDGGQLLAPSAGALGLPRGGAVALDGSHIGVYDDDGAFDGGFTDFASGAPAPDTVPGVDSTGQYDSAYADQVASIPDPSAPGQYLVVVVGADDTAPSSGCPAGTGEATGYGLGVGSPAQLQTQSAWSANYFKPICQAASPVLAGGGPAGGTIGLFEAEGAGLTGAGSNGVYYRTFDPATSSFGAPTTVHAYANSAPQLSNLSVAQDAGGGAYATWSDQAGFWLSYSPSGGSRFDQRVEILQGADVDPVGPPTVVGLGGGTADIAYSAAKGDGEDEYLATVSGG